MLKNPHCSMAMSFDEGSESAKARESNQINLNTRDTVVVHIGSRFFLFLRSSVSTEDLIVILRFLFLIYYFFFLLDFSKTPGRIFMKFSGMVYIGLERLKKIVRVMTSLPVRDIDDFLIFRVSFCSEIFSETAQDIFFKFLRMVDKRLKYVP